MGEKKIPRARSRANPIIVVIYELVVDSRRCNSSFPALASSLWSNMIMLLFNESYAEHNALTRWLMAPCSLVALHYELDQFLILIIWGPNPTNGCEYFKIYWQNKSMSEVLWCSLRWKDLGSFQSLQVPLSWFHPGLCLYSSPFYFSFSPTFF